MRYGSREHLDFLRRLPLFVSAAAEALALGATRRVVGLPLSIYDLREVDEHVPADRAARHRTRLESIAKVLPPRTRPFISVLIENVNAPLHYSAQGFIIRDSRRVLALQRRCVQPLTLGPTSPNDRKRLEAALRFIDADVWLEATKGLLAAGDVAALNATAAATPESDVVASAAGYPSVESAAITGLIEPFRQVSYGAHAADGVRGS